MATITFKKENGIVDLSRIEKALYSAFSLLKNGEYQLSIVRKVNRRTNQQNHLMWLWMNCIGQNLGLTKDDAKEVVCYDLSTDEVEIDGKTYKIPIKTSKMDVEQMNTFLDKVKYWADTKFGIQLPEPSDLLFEEFERQYRY